MINIPGGRCNCHVLYGSPMLKLPSTLFSKVCKHRTVSRFAPGQWETSLQNNAVSYWLGANRKISITPGNISVWNILTLNSRGNIIDKCVLCNLFRRGMDKGTLMTLGYYVLRINCYSTCDAYVCSDKWLKINAGNDKTFFGGKPGEKGNCQNHWQLLTPMSVRRISMEFIVGLTD